ncbi:MAG: hypothetical protein AAFY19_00685 [Pseudomonadota bacterium]
MAGTPFLLADQGCNIYVGVIGETVAATTWTSLPRASDWQANQGETQKVNFNSFDTPLDQNDERNSRPQTGNASVSFYLQIDDATQELLLNNRGSIIPIRCEFTDGEGNKLTLDSLFEIGTNDLNAAALDEVKQVTVQLAKQGPTVQTKTPAV